MIKFYIEGKKKTSISHCWRAGKDGIHLEKREHLCVCVHLSACAIFHEISKLELLAYSIKHERYRISFVRRIEEQVIAMDLTCSFWHILAQNRRLRAILDLNGRSLRGKGALAMMHREITGIM
eukprot:TRINITY_DN5133_c0_g1_i1.p1 TRINITY_DN5133_c0_g1~~TRINITY_DN5133_c0_g1_i1.p1  ORF type:complete len:123 (-),score=10.85 TRINITY_DN5133_c0_g1_i1:684-1052(-)